MINVRSGKEALGLAKAYLRHKGLKVYIDQVRGYGHAVIVAKPHRGWSQSYYVVFKTAFFLRGSKIFGLTPPTDSLNYHKLHWALRHCDKLLMIYADGSMYEGDLYHIWESCMTYNTIRKQKITHYNKLFPQEQQVITLSFSLSWLEKVREDGGIHMIRWLTCKDGVRQRYHVRGTYVAGEKKEQQEDDKSG